MFLLCYVPISKRVDLVFVQEYLLCEHFHYTADRRKTEKRRDIFDNNLLFLKSNIHVPLRM